MSKQQYTRQMTVKRNDFLEKGYELFSTKTIEAVNLTDVADASTYGIATLYRYFRKKPGFVVAVARWKWDQLREKYEKRKTEISFDGMTGADMLEYFLDSFIVMYKKYPDLLRFNQFFKIYVQSENLDTEVLEPYFALCSETEKPFRLMYERALEDHTVKTDMPVEEMHSEILHLMLATVTSYAVGKVYPTTVGFDPIQELTVQKEMFLDRFLTK